MRKLIMAVNATQENISPKKGIFQKDKGQRFLILVFLLSCLTTTAFSQKPYWQQKVDTRIHVTLDDTLNRLEGTIQMNYVNHSPDTLNFIYFHLYPNAYKNDRTAFDSQAVQDGNKEFYYASEKDKGFIDSLDFLVNKKSAHLEILQNIDEAILLLPKPLLPGDSIEIFTPFRVKIPKVFSRMGHDGQSFQISQWYPKPAAYDQKGWHIFPYLDQGEYYSEFGSYDVWITLPKNYILMATGNMVGAPEEEKWLDQLATRPIPTDPAGLKSIPPSSPITKTLHFHEDNIHDFAWFADKRWVVRKDTINIPGELNPIIGYRCFFPENKNGWSNSKETLKKAIETFSKEVGPYPYKTVKVVEGVLSANSGGMEYPTIAVIQSGNEPDFIDIDIFHEVGHNWFYGILATNERDYPWMDEGINSFYEQKFQLPPGNLNGVSYGKFSYFIFSAVHQLQPSNLPATDFAEGNYNIDVYEKVPLFLTWLEAYMGADRFGAAMQDYYRQYKFKHPQPEDFERIFKQHASKNIDWFFKGLSDGRPVDYAIRSVKTKKDSLCIRLKNKTGFEGPVLLNFITTKKGGSDSLLYQDWVPPFVGKTQFSLPRNLAGDFNRTLIDTVVPDFNIANNTNKSSLSPHLFLGLNAEPEHKFWLSPAIGYNYYDGFMAGLVIHNLTLPVNRFQFALVPLFGTKSKKFAGTGFISYSWFPNASGFKEINIKLEGKGFDDQKTTLNQPSGVFAGYQKLAPELTLVFKKPFARSPVERSLSLKGYWIREESLAFQMNPEDSLYYPGKGPAVTHLYARARYTLEKGTTFNPYGYQLEGQIGKDFAKLNITAHLKVDYFMEDKGLYIRGYLGKMFGLGDNPLDWSRYELSATYSGINDYLFDQTFVARTRNTGFFANQIAMEEGGMKVNTLQYANRIGLSDNWLGSLNLETDLPLGKVPVQIFGDLAAFPKAEGTGTAVIFDAGFQVKLGNYATVYFPVVMSKDLNDYVKSVLGKNHFLKTISFSLNLNQIKWTRISDYILKLL